MTALHSDEYRRFAQALADARRRAGLSQYDLADRLRVDQSFVSKYETGRRRLDVIEFLQIVRAIGTEHGAILDLVATGLPDRISTLPEASGSEPVGSTRDPKGPQRPE